MWCVLVSGDGDELNRSGEIEKWGRGWVDF